MEKTKQINTTKQIEISDKAIKKAVQKLCGISLILCGIISARATGESTASVLLIHLGIGPCGLFHCL